MQKKVYIVLLQTFNCDAPRETLQKAPEVIGVFESLGDAKNAFKDKKMDICLKEFGQLPTPSGYKVKSTDTHFYLEDEVQGNVQQLFLLKSAWNKRNDIGFVGDLCAYTENGNKGVRCADSQENKR